MSDRILNGNFLDGWTNWTLTSYPTPPHDSPGIGYDTKTPFPWTARLPSRHTGWWIAITQSNVNLTDVDTLTFSCRDSWRDSYNTGRLDVFFQGNLIYSNSDLSNNYIDVSVDVSSCTGTGDLKFLMTSTWNGSYLFIYAISAIGPYIPVPPVADFTAMAITGEAPFYCEFVDLSTNSPNYWIWDLGDGWVLGVQNPTHVYKNGGVYTVSLTSQNDDGSDTKTKVDFIVVVWGDIHFSPLYQMAIGPAP